MGSNPTAGKSACKCQSNPGISVESITRLEQFAERGSKIRNTAATYNTNIRSVVAPPCYNAGMATLLEFVLTIVGEILMALWEEKSRRRPKKS